MIHARARLFFTPAWSHARQCFRARQCGSWTGRCRSRTAVGWFANNAFTLGAAPFTHTIGYAISGFLESGLLLGAERYLRAARKAARATANTQRNDGWLAGAYGRNWTPEASYCCLTGVAQMA